MPLHVGLRGRAAVEQCVGVDERKVLALLVGEERNGWLWGAGHGDGEMIDELLEREPYMNFRYRVTLTAEERTQLQAMAKKGKGPVRRLKRAQILLAADLGSSDEVIATNVAVGTSTVYRTKRRFVEEGLEQALSEDPRPCAARKLSVTEEALLVATACTKPPAGQAHWTMHLLADEMVRLTAHERLSDETVRRRLAEKNLKPWQEKMWCLPKVDAEFVARMEDVLALYAETPDEQRPESALTRHRDSSSARRACRSRSSRASRRESTTSTSATAPRTCSCSST